MIIIPSEILGFFASALVLITFAMKDMRLLRRTAILSNVAFIIYGWSNGLFPVLALHVLLLPLNIHRLRQSPGSEIGSNGEPATVDRATLQAIAALHLANALREKDRSKAASGRLNAERSTRICFG